jgi:hypothetical protein
LLTNSKQFLSVTRPHIVDYIVGDREK